ncbi:MAG: replicative DNA helicase [Caulobacteraceae bacterium]
MDSYSAEEAQKAVLGAVMANNDLIEELETGIEPDDFIEPYKSIYEAIKYLYSCNIEATPITVMNQIEKGEASGMIEFAMLGNMVTNSFIPASLTPYINIITSNAVKRKAANIIKSIQSKALTEEGINTVVEQLVNCTQRLSSNKSIENGFVPELLDSTLTEIEERNSKKGLAGISSGFSELDRLTGGWQPGRYYVLGARPKVGKTSLFSQIASTAAEQVPTVVFSLEMTKQELMRLLLYQAARLDSMKEQTGTLQEADFDRMTKACTGLSKLNLWIEDKVRTIPQIITSLKLIQKEFSRKSKGPVGLIVIDYVQLIQGDNRLSRNYQLEQISRDLKNIAKDYNLCILALAQVNRSVEERQNKRPLPSDLKDSGSFEQDADGLLLMYRDAYYNDRNEKNSLKYNFGGEKVIADIVDINMFLNRHGAAGQFQLDFLTQYRRFVEHGDNGNPFM